jgi:hypothetical protein
VILVPRRSGELPIIDERIDLGWYRRNVALLRLPAEDLEVEVAREVCWRIEAEEGVVADGGAALAWLAEQIAYEEGPYAAAWRQALRAPLQKILQSLEASDEAEETWNKVAEGDGPYLGYRVIDPVAGGGTGKPQVQTEHIDKIGTVTPVGQVRRILRQAAASALELAWLEVAKEHGKVLSLRPDAGGPA